MKEEKLIDKLSKEPYLMKLTEEEYRAMQQGDDFKNKIFDVREKLDKSLTPEQFEWLDKRNKQTELQKEFNELGGFVFVVYQKLGNIFDNSVLSLEDKSKILLLSTYVSYDTNKLTYKNNKPIRKEMLPMVLRVSERSIRTFLKKVISLGILKIEDGELYLSRDLFFKGETKNVHQIKDENFGYTRLFLNTYQYLYENIPKRQQRYLGIIYSLIPYMNFHHNFLVNSNPEETDIDKLDIMSFDQFCKICGYKDNLTPQAKSCIKNGLLKLHLEDGNPVFALVKTNNITKILINPHIVYSSSNVDTWNSTLKIIFKYNKKI